MDEQPNDLAVDGWMLQIPRAEYPDDVASLKVRSVEGT